MPVTNSSQGFLALGTDGDSPAIALANSTTGTSAVIGLDPADSGKFKVFADVNNPSTLTDAQFSIDPSTDGHITLTPNGTGTVDITNANIISGTIDLTSATVGNIHVASNTISSTNSDGDIILAPNGTGVVEVTGINSVNVGSVASVASVGSSGQLGTTVITAGSGISVTPGSNTITIASTESSSITITGDTGGGLTGNSFTFTGGTTGLSFGGSGSTETLTFAGITANGGTVSLATDATTSTVNIGTGAGLKTVTLGSTNSTSATTLQSGSGNLNVTSTNGALTIDSGTGALGISTDSSATTVHIGTGSAAKTVVVGSTNSSSSTAIKSGSGGIQFNSGLFVYSSGINQSGVQPVFNAYLNNTQANVTGDGTVYTIICDGVMNNQGSYYNGSTGVFTAPLSGNYLINFNFSLNSLGIATSAIAEIVTSTIPSYQVYQTGLSGILSTGQITISTCAILALSASETISFTVQVSGTTKTVGVAGGFSPVVTFVSGYLLC